MSFCRIVFILLRHFVFLYYEKSGGIKIDQWWSEFKCLI